MQFVLACGLVSLRAPLPNCRGTFCYTLCMSFVQARASCFLLRGANSVGVPAAATVCSVSCKVAEPLWPKRGGATAVLACVSTVAGCIVERARIGYACTIS